MERNIAAQLFVNKTEKDLNLYLLELIDLTKNLDLKKVISFYQKMKLNEIKVVAITTSIDLTIPEKQIIEKSLQEKFKELDLEFVYVVDQKFEKGIEIRIGDSIVEL